MQRSPQQNVEMVMGFPPILPRCPRKRLEAPPPRAGTGPSKKETDREGKSLQGDGHGVPMKCVPSGIPEISRNFSSALNFGNVRKRFDAKFFLVHDLDSLQID